MLLDAPSPTQSLPTAGTLKVPGATLYYEMRGHGPLLLLIPGGASDAGIYDAIAEHLAAHYTIVAYDTRGHSRSPLDGAPEDQDVDRLGDDAAALIAALGDAPAFVFGSSGGAQIGLNLAARHPERVRVLVAHEPPCVNVLDDGSGTAAIDAIYAAYREKGVMAALAAFTKMTGTSGPSKLPPSPALFATLVRMKGNLRSFFAHGLRPIAGYVADVAALRAAGAPRVVVAVGAASEGELPYRTAVALAARLGVAPVTFPGGHDGYNGDSGAFAVTLKKACD